ncbi:MAG: birA, biotin-(acetyl-CoA-carboxylase) ligase [Actinomycetia bacterium]|nr:birA, biotin-(acetyl-CoA-carboxylase) ligase [Actinomycetes bacterium]
MPDAPATWTVSSFETLDSTNRYALDAARAGADAGLVVVAAEQTAGRGRLGRSWIAPPGAALLCSVLLRPDLAPERLHLLTAAGALAMAEAVEDVCGLRPDLKWPNDLLVGDRKLAGVLAEADIDGRAVHAVVVGVGLNVQWDGFPPELARIATSCSRETGAPVSIPDVLAAFLARASIRLADLDAAFAEYRSRLGTLGRSVRVELASGPVVGIAVDLAPDGMLLVETASDGVVAVTAGDVVHLRPA